MASVIDEFDYSLGHIHKDTVTKHHEQINEGFRERGKLTGWCVE